MTNTDLSPDDCGCYECVGSRITYTDDGTRYVANNMKYHTLGDPCDDCGRPKGHYLDLGRKGYYVCYWCDGPGYTDSGHNPPDIPDLSTLSTAQTLREQHRRFYPDP